LKDLHANDNILTSESSEKNPVSNIRTASIEQLTELFISKQPINFVDVDTALGRLLEFDLKDGATLKQVTIFLNAFVTSRSALAMDRLPVLQQRLKMVCVACLELENEEVAVDIAHLVEGLGVALAKHKKDMIRVAPYFAADVLGLFETKIIRQSLKVTF
jgi:hypothetical protein